MYINAVGYYIPTKRVNNDHFTQTNGLTDEWIRQRTGIRTRARASEKETSEFMCFTAVKHALPRLPYPIEDVDLVVFASYTPADTIVTTGHIIQRIYNISRAKVFYISSACSSAVNAIEIIQSFFISGKVSKALLVCAERNSSYSDDSDKVSGHLWGDGAVAYFFSNDKFSDEELQVLDVTSQGLGHIGMGTQAITLNLKKGKLQMPIGRDVFLQACKYMAKSVEEITYKNGYTISDLTYFIGHQANTRILDNVIKQLNIPKGKSLSNMQELGNTGSASTLLVLGQNYDRFKTGDLICISVFGGGYSCGACLLKKG
ncbi:MAG TPA: ketoacyl-ACP synthase III [Dysgonomonas sp.]|uniref:3-oxoacyl-ACP synthase III family protein n=1 Tax=unclassified Dysgonomonas TaxID=2630389 RepID=UPI0025BE169F|nr:MULTISPECIES: ketoacyl-ACP synthase III [unclassified Dysgonomonas]HML65150.1 ketoacyl-ACP synthase III [Dysgonomonas sp.]